MSFTPIPDAAGDEPRTRSGAAPSPTYLLTTAACVALAFAGGAHWGASSSSSVSSTEFAAGAASVAASSAAVRQTSTGEQRRSSGDDAAAVAVATEALAAARAAAPAAEVAQFDAFKAKFGRKYASASEETTRLGHFRARLLRIDAANARNLAAGGKGDVFGVSKLADYSEHEWDSLRGYRPAQEDTYSDDDADLGRDKATVWHGPTMSYSPYSQSSKRVDWREQGAITPIKNQGQCGSCWAFSATSQIESEWFLNGNALNEFSPQQIASCVTDMMGCGGGTTSAAYKYLEDSETAGIATSWFYPWTQSMVPGTLENPGICLSKGCTKDCKPLTMMIEQTTFAGPYAQVSGHSFATKPCFRDCNNQSLGELKANLAKRGPASICVNAGEWDNYVGGVMTATAGGEWSFGYLDHCVHLVGYNAAPPDNEMPYWIVRNSWDTTWGLDGYIYLQMSENTCGVADVAQFVDVGPPDGAFRYHNASRESASGNHR